MLCFHVSELELWHTRTYTREYKPIENNFTKTAQRMPATLHYWRGRGRAETLRLMMAATGVPVWHRRTRILDFELAVDGWAVHADARRHR